MHTCWLTVPTAGRNSWPALAPWWWDIRLAALFAQLQIPTEVYPQRKQTVTWKLGDASERQHTEEGSVSRQYDPY